MPYVIRNGEGRISKVTMVILPGTEYLPHDHAEVVQYLVNKGQDPKKVEEALNELKRTDAEMSRAIEDVIMALFKKNILKMTDLPKPVQERMAFRAKMRVIISDIYDQAAGN